MANSTDSLVLEILKGLQADMATLKADVSTLKTDVVELKKMDKRLDNVEQIVSRIRRDNAGMLLLMRAAAGAVEERLAVLEADYLQRKGMPDPVA